MESTAVSSESPDNPVEVLSSRIQISLKMERTEDCLNGGVNDTVLISSLAENVDSDNERTEVESLKNENAELQRLLSNTMKELDNEKKRVAEKCESLKTARETGKESMELVGSISMKLAKQENETDELKRNVEMLKVEVVEKESEITKLADRCFQLEKKIEKEMCLRIEELEKTPEYINQKKSIISLREKLKKERSECQKNMKTVNEANEMLDRQLAQLEKESEEKIEEMSATISMLNASVEGKQELCRNFLSDLMSSFRQMTELLLERLERNGEGGSSSCTDWKRLEELCAGIGNSLQELYGDKEHRNEELEQINGNCKILLERMASETSRERLFQESLEKIKSLEEKVIELEALNSEENEASLPTTALPNENFRALESDHLFQINEINEEVPHSSAKLRTCCRNRPDSMGCSNQLEPISGLGSQEAITRSDINGGNDDNVGSMTLRSNGKRPQHGVNVSATGHVCVCGKEVSSKAALNKHIVHFNQACRFSCDYCWLTFRTTFEVAAHAKKEHNSVYKRKGCRRCGNTFSTLSELYCHQNQNSCSLLAKRSTRSEMEALQHAEDVSKKRQGRDERFCTCRKRFKSRKALTAHIRSTKAKDVIFLKRKFECNVCHSRFLYHGDLQKHYLRSHNITNSRSRGYFGCRYCGMLLPTLLMLRQHHKHAHPNEIGKPVEGSAEEESQNIKTTTKKKHEVVTRHPLQEGHYCVCGKSFGTKECLRRHITKFTQEGKFKCSICEQRFHFFSFFKRHMSSNHSVSEMELSTLKHCKYCGEIFCSNDELYSHRKSAPDCLRHSGGGPVL